MFSSTVALGINGPPRVIAVYSFNLPFHFYKLITNGKAINCSSSMGIRLPSYFIDKTAIIKINFSLWHLREWTFLCMYNIYVSTWLIKHL